MFFELFKQECRNFQRPSELVQYRQEYSSHSLPGSNRANQWMRATAEKYSSVKQLRKFDKPSVLFTQYNKFVSLYN